MKYKKVQDILPREIRNEMNARSFDWEQMQEIRLRIGQPVRVRFNNHSFVCHTIVRRENLSEIMEYISDFSLHAYENELRQGFITLEGGHRVGIAGDIKNIKNVSSLNIRIAHQVKGCADAIMPYILQGSSVCHSLIVSPPKCGKTTMLRDVIRQISDRGINVGVVDERSELAGCYQGIPQNDVGTCTDVLDACSKTEGMLRLIRSMSPDVIAVDEIGGVDEVEAMKYAMRCGVKILATVHGESFEELQKKPLFEQLIKEGYFEQYIILRKGKTVGEIAKIYDAQTYVFRGA